MDGFKLLNSNRWAFDVCYELNKTTILPKGSIIVGKRGLHFCTKPHLLLSFKRFHTDLIFCKVRATGIIVEKNDIFATDQLTVVQEFNIDELWKSYSKDIIDFFQQSDDLQKEQLLNYICQWDANFVNSLKHTHLRLWAQMSKGEIVDFEESMVKKLIPKLSHFCYSKKHCSIVEKYWHDMTFSVVIVHWDKDFLEWFTTDEKRKHRLIDVVSRSSFTLDLLQKEIEIVNVWCKRFCFIQQNIYSLLKSTKVKIVDYRFSFWLHNTYDMKRMHAIPLCNFGIFITGNSQLINTLQRYRSLKPTMMDIYDLYKNGHLYYFEFFFESMMNAVK